MSKRKHLIIGCGSAGLSAAEEIRRISAGDEIKIVTLEDYPPYSPTILPYLISGRTVDTNVFMRGEGYFDRMKATCARGKEVTQVLPEDKEVVYRDGERETYDTLLIASGAEPSQPPIKGLWESRRLGFRILEQPRGIGRWLMLEAEKRESASIQA